jgi:hypothetical protein
MLAAFKTCDDYVWFPLLLDANTTIHAWQNKAFTVSASETLILFWQSGSGPHGDFPRDGNISLSQLRIIVNGLFCETEESVDALQSYALSGIHFS